MSSTPASDRGKLRDIYDPEYVKSLFDEMSSTYEAVNYLSSFGFTHRWRQQFIKKASIRPGMLVCDLMCGMGECWSAITRHLSVDDRLIAQDFSNGMLRGAKRKSVRFHGDRVCLLQQNALNNALKDQSVDAVICGFGVKTLPSNQLYLLVDEVERILKHGGTFAFIEVSVPEGWVLETLYMHYLRQIVPIVGKLLLGNPENYRMLGEYTQRFQSCRGLYSLMAKRGLRVRYDEYFYGCATGVSGIKI